jgi:hypothetical protein
MLSGGVGGVGGGPQKARKPLFPFSKRRYFRSSAGDVGGGPPGTRTKEYGWGWATAGPAAANRRELFAYAKFSKDPI